MTGHWRTWHGGAHTHFIPPMVLLPWLSSMSSCGSNSVHYPMASTGWDIYPSAKCMRSCRHPLPLHITWSLHPSSVDALADVHGRSHSFLLIHPREVFLAWHWVIARPLSSHGIVSLSLLPGSRLNWGGAGTSVPCLADTHTQGNASFWCNKRRSQLWCRGTCDLYYHTEGWSSHLSLCA